LGTQAFAGLKGEYTSLQPGLAADATCVWTAELLPEHVIAGKMDFRLGTNVA